MINSAIYDFINKTIKTASLKVVVYSLLLFTIVGNLTSNHASDSDTEVYLFLPDNHKFCYAGFYTAIEKGYYDDQGLTLNILTEKEQTDQINKVIRGDADFSIAGSTLLLGHNRDLPVVALGALLQNSPLGIFSLTENNINKPEDFKNKTAIAEINTNRWIIDYILYKNNISSNSLTFIPASTTENIKHLLDKNIDLLVGSSAEIPYLLKENNIPYNILRPVDFDINFYDEIIFTSKAYLKNNPDTVQNFLKATWEGWKYAFSNRSEIIELIQEEYNDNLTTEQLEEEAEIIYQQARPDIIPLGSMSASRWKETSEIFTTLGLLPNKYLLDDFIYNPDSRYLLDNSTTVLTNVFALLFLIFLSVLLYFNTRLKRKITSDKIVLNENKQRLQIALENANEGLWDWDVENDIFYFTPGCFTILSYKPDEIDYSLDIWKSFIHPDDYSRVITAIDNFIYHPKEDSAFYLDMRIRTKELNYIYISLQLTLQEKTLTGSAKRIIATQRDITNEKKNEEILKNRIYQLTRPVNDSQDIKFTDIFDIDKIQALQDSLATATNTSSSIVDNAGNYITRPSNSVSLCKLVRTNPAGLSLCKESDSSFKLEKGKYFIKNCKTLGLIDGGTSIWVGDKLIASWYIGQVRYNDEFTEKMKEAIKKFHLDQDKFLDELKKVPIVSPKKFANACEVMAILADQLSEMAYQNVMQARAINEKHQTESQLRKSERRLRQAQKLSHVGHWTYNPVTQKITGSKEFWEILNMSEQTSGLSARNFLDKISISNKKEIIAAFYAGLTHDKGIDIEFSLDNTAKKEKKYLHILTQHKEEHKNLKDTDKLPLLQGTLQNITDRAENENALRESKENLRITFESIADGLITTDNNGIITRINPIALKLLGYGESEDIIGSDAAEVIKLYESEARLPVKNPVTEVLLTKEKSFYQEQLILISDNNTDIYVTANASPIMTKDNKLLGVVLTLHDVTEQYLLEESLRQSQKMEAIGKLAGGVAHDFNNLLGGIIGFADLINLKSSDDNILKYTNQIIDTAERASDLTSQMLTFSRKQSAATTPIDIHESIIKALTILEHSIKKTIIIKKDFTAEISNIIGDAAQIQNCFLNLGINARDAMKNNGEFTVITKNVFLDNEYCENSEFTLTSGNYIQINVIDTGSGISPTIIKRIFEPFFTTKATGKGTGLGLSAIFNTIVSHNGSITAESEVGKGTEFEILLPTTTLKLKEKVEIINNIVAPTRKTILLVDDELVIRTMGKSIFEDSGYKVLLAENGEQALKVYLEKSHIIDLVIMDLVMPIMDGEEALQRLLDMDPDVKVVLTSGFPKSDNITRLLKLGAREFITKPYKSIDILNKIGKII